MRTTFILICLLSLTAFAQTDEITTLKQQADQLLAKGSLNELIDVGEKIVKLEKRLGPANSADYMDSLLRVASWKRQRLVARTPDSTLALGKIEHEIGEIEGDYRELMSAATRAKDNARLATANLELAKFYLGPRTRASLEKIEELLVKAVSLRDTPSQNQEFATIMAVGELAAFYYKFGDLEKYHPLAVRYIESLDARSAAEKKEMLRFLRTYADFLMTIDRKAEAMEFSKQIAAIQGTPYGPVAGNLIMRGEPRPKVFFGRSTQRSREALAERLKKSSKAENDPKDKNSDGNAVTSRKEYSRTLVRNRPAIVESNIVDVETAPNQTFSRQNAYVVLLTDETGKVVEATAHSRIAVDRKIRDEIREQALTWKFRPFVLNGQPQRLRATITVFVAD